MNQPTIPPAQRRENRDPHEKANPAPWSVFLLVGLMCIFGIVYIATTQTNVPSEWGDGRSEAELLASAGTGGANGMADGAAIYASRCVACHQANGSGLPGVFPPLAGSEWVTGDSKRLAFILLHGVSGTLTVRGTTYNGSMPAFKDQLNDAEIAAVMTHIRSQWGNSAEGVVPDAVAGIRKATAERTDPVKGDVELLSMK